MDNNQEKKFWERTEEEVFEALFDVPDMPFSYRQLNSLVKYIKRQMRISRNKKDLLTTPGCDGTLRITEEWAKTQGFSDNEYIVLRIFLKKHGAYCDCEVLSNAQSFLKKGKY